MKKMALLITLFATACASLGEKPEELKQAKTCQVWTQDAIGATHTSEVQDEVAKQKITCWVMNMFLCSYTNYTYRPGTSEILSDLGDKDKTIGKLDGDKLSISMTGLTADPFPIKNGIAKFERQGPIGPKSSKTVEYNQACSTRQVALGILSLSHL